MKAGTYYHLCFGILYTYKDRAKAILENIQYGNAFVYWGQHKAEAFALVKEAEGYNPSNKGCLACNIKAVNILRGLCDLPPIGQEASESLRSRRLHICRGVAGDGSDACEHLRWGDLNCGICGCFVDIKATFAKFRCPIGKWPTK